MNDSLLNVNEDEFNFPRNFPCPEVQFSRIPSVSVEMWWQKSDSASAIETSVS
jgi:hypothetical protein